MLDAAFLESLIPGKHTDVARNILAQMLGNRPLRIKAGFSQKLSVVERTVSIIDPMEGVLRGDLLEGTLAVERGDCLLERLEVEEVQRVGERFEKGLHFGAVDDRVEFLCFHEHLGLLFPAQAVEGVGVAQKVGEARASPLHQRKPFLL